MAKHRKTLEQKKLADLRRKFYSFDRVKRDLDQVRLGLDAISESKNVAITVSPTNKYPYLISDILKTGILTGLIIVMQIILFFLLKNHVLVLPMVKY